MPHGPTEDQVELILERLQSEHNRLAAETHSTETKGILQLADRFLTQARSQLRDHDPDAAAATLLSSVRCYVQLAENFQEGIRAVGRELERLRGQ